MCAAVLHIPRYAATLPSPELHLPRQWPPNAPVHPPGPLQRRGVARKQNAAPVVVQRLVRPETLNVPDARCPFVRIISMSRIEFRSFFSAMSSFLRLLDRLLGTRGEKDCDHQTRDRQE